MEGIFHIELKGSKNDAAQFLSFLDAQQGDEQFDFMKQCLALPDGFDALDGGAATKLIIRPEDSGNLFFLDFEDVVAQMAAAVPALDLRASITYYVDEGGETVYTSPAGDDMVSEYFPIYCAACGKELSEDEIVADDNGELYCQECAENGFEDPDALDEEYDEEDMDFGDEE